MAGERVFIDTNILLYSVDPTPQAAAKQRVAEQLLQDAHCAVSVQVLQEFFHQATRPRSSCELTPEEVWSLTMVWRRFPVQENTLALLDHAFVLYRRDRFSWWDSLIVAAAIAQGCAILYTENMQDGRIVDGLRILNPFREGAVAL